MLVSTIQTEVALNQVQVQVSGDACRMEVLGGRTALYKCGSGLVVGSDGSVFRVSERTRDIAVPRNLITHLKRTDRELMSSV